MLDAPKMLAAWRSSRGLTLKAAADLLGSRWWNLRRYESGEREPPASFVAAAWRVARVPVKAWAKNEAVRP